MFVGNNSLFWGVQSGGGVSLADTLDFFGDGSMLATWPFDGSSTDFYDFI